MDHIQDINEYLKIIKDSFTKYNIYSQIENFNDNKKIIFILGNTSCDMDSVISSIFLSIFRNLFLNSKNLFLKNYKNTNCFYVPIMNCEINDFCDRLDIIYLLKQYNIDFKNLIFIDDQNLIEEFSVIRNSIDSSSDDFMLSNYSDYLYNFF